ncbi:Aspyridones efflux protein apdF [Colletotrichum tropicale]|nr:Aspyridones efflux protein apdF [Colletotrichum tropicale]
MVLAIGAAHLSRRTKVALSAEGYYSSAMKLVDEILKTSSIASLPLDVGDEQLKLDQLKPRQELEPPTNVTSAIHLFRLARFNSEIKCVLYCVDRQYPPYTQPMVVDAESWRVDILSRLRQWKHNIPRHPEGSPGHYISTLCEIKYHELTMLILRPSPRIQNPDKASLRECFQSALTCTELYHSLYVANSLQYGWLSIHSLFLCVMAMFYCVWKPSEIVKEEDFDTVIRALKVASDILSAIGEHWPEAKRSRDILDRISTATIRRFTQHLNKRGPLPTPQESRTSVEVASNLSSEPVMDWSDMGQSWSGTSPVQFRDEGMINTPFAMNYGANDKSFMSADIMSYFLGSSADATMGPNDFVHVMDDAPNYFVGISRVELAYIRDRYSMAATTGFPDQADAVEKTEHDLELDASQHAIDRRSGHDTTKYVTDARLNRGNDARGHCRYEGSKNIQDSRTNTTAERVPNVAAASSLANPGPPPDGGLWAWLCVLGTFLVVMNTWGVINSFGVFQSYYVKALDRAPSDISWIGSINVFLLFFIGTFTGRLTDAGFFRPLSISGAILTVTGTLTTSACTKYWQIFLAQGVCVGIGSGCLFCPAVAIVSTYFNKRRSLAIGITACGSGVGGILYPVLVRQLLPRVGFGWTMRTIGFVQGGGLAIAVAILRPRVLPRKTGQFVEWSAFRELEYTSYACGSVLCLMGAYFAFFFVAAYARDIQGMSYTNSLNLVMMMSGVGMVGRLLLTHLADRFGNLTVFVPTAGAGALLLFSWIAVSSPAGVYVWASFSGMATGGIQSLFPSALASLTSDPQKQGTRIGMVFTIVSFAGLIGPPIGGALISAVGGSYVGAQAFAGTSLSLGMAFMMTAREVKRRKKGQDMWMKV